MIFLEKRIETLLDIPNAIASQYSTRWFKAELVSALELVVKEEKSELIKSQRFGLDLD